MRAAILSMEPQALNKGAGGSSARIRIGTLREGSMVRRPVDLAAGRNGADVLHIRGTLLQPLIPGFEIGMLWSLGCVSDPAMRQCAGGNVGHGELVAANKGSAG